MTSKNKQSVFVPLLHQKYFSLDPLDADRIPNLPVARMIYATPIEVSPDNTLVSQVLSSFSFEADSNSITWRVKPDLKFSDGSVLSADDVAFSIARMLYARPNFPVIEAIEGVADWKKLETPLASLPSGLAVADDTIKISFSKPIANPLFRFTLELFSILPKRCIDLKTNKITCHPIPTSGNYVIAAEDQSSVRFVQRISPEYIHGIQAPQEITFRYIPSNYTASDLQQLDERMVFHGAEYSLRLRKIDFEKEGFSVRWTPAANFVSLLISPLVKPFDRPECRRLFADTFRSAIADELGASLDTEPSLFPALVSGYLPEQELKKTFEPNKSCLEYIRKYPIQWARFPEEKKYFIDLLVARTARKLGAKLAKPIIAHSGDNLEKAINEGKSSFYPFVTGFWALDPVGDIRMLFTPALHSDLKQAWADTELQKMLTELGNITEGQGIKAKMEEINRHIYSHAVFNPVLQFRKLYAARSPEALRTLPLAVQEPYPWQILSNR